jgi:hypothetical protein
MRSDDRAPAIGRRPWSSNEIELDELQARGRRQAVVIQTLGELVATFKSDARALKAENAWLRAENARLRGHSRSISQHGARLMAGAEPTEAAIPLA